MPGLGGNASGVSLRPEKGGDGRVESLHRARPRGPASGAMRSNTCALGRRLLQLCIQMHAAACGDLQLPLPVLESRLLHGDGVLAFGDLDIRRSVADETAIDFDVGAVGDRGYGKFPCQSASR